jgi:hypothetical protein
MGESRTSGVPDRSTSRIILETPNAERTAPVTNAITPRAVRVGGMLAPSIEKEIAKESSDRVGGSADARNFFQEGIDEIAPIVRNRTGSEKIRTTKKPNAQKVVFATVVPTKALRGNTTTSKDQERISSPISLRKSRTFSLERSAAELSPSPTNAGIRTVRNEKSKRVGRLRPAKGRARTDPRAIMVRKTEITWMVEGKPILRMKLKAPTVPPTPSLTSLVMAHH